MDKRIIDLWADIGSEEYWDRLMNRQQEFFIPLKDRLPQPGYIGSRYFDMPSRVVVMGQNPGTPKAQWELDDDDLMLKQIRNHSNERTLESLRTMFSLMPEYMLGERVGRRAWAPMAIVKKLELSLDNVVLLNLIPLCHRNAGIVPAFKDAFEISTKRQLEVLKPDKIVVFGKGAYDCFMNWGGREWNVRHIAQRNHENVPAVRRWLNV